MLQGLLSTGGEEIVEIDGEGSVVWHVAIYSKAGRGERGHNRGSRSNPGIRGVYKAVFVDTAARWRQPSAARAIFEPLWDAATADDLTRSAA